MAKRRTSPPWYRALERLDRESTIYEKYELVELDEETAAILLDLGLIEPAYLPASPLSDKPETEAAE